MLRHITLAVIALLIAAPAHAATKAEVAAAGCITKEQARKASPTDHLYYRRIGGKECWYSNTALTKKAATKAAVKPATITAPIDLESLGALQIKRAIDNELMSTFELLCGGPCPQLKDEFRQRWPK